MIKVTVMYPYTEGARFDHVYYRDQHMPMVKARLAVPAPTTPSKKALPAEHQVHRPPSWRCARSFVIRPKATKPPCRARRRDPGRHRQLHRHRASGPVSEVVVERSDR
jgi:hypothetical protein